MYSDFTYPSIPLLLSLSIVLCLIIPSPFRFFFFNDTATTEIYTLSLHDALPICHGLGAPADTACYRRARGRSFLSRTIADRKSTRLNSSHLVISYAVFCLKKKKETILLNENHTVIRLNYEHTLCPDVEHLSILQS